MPLTRAQALAHATFTTRLWRYGVPWPPLAMAVATVVAQVVPSAWVALSPSGWRRHRTPVVALALASSYATGALLTPTFLTHQREAGSPHAPLALELLVACLAPCVLVRNGAPPPPPPRAALDPCAGWPGRRREGEGGPAGREHARMPTPCSRRTQMGQAVVQLPAALRMLVASSAAVAGLATVRSTCRELLLLDPGLARRLPSAVYVLNRLLGCGAGQGALRGARWSTATTTPTHTRVHKHAGVPPVHPTGLGLCWCLGGARRTPAERPPASARCCRPFCCCCWQCCCRVARRY